jgi:hypothetical protein
MIVEEVALNSYPPIMKGRLTYPRFYQLDALQQKLVGELIVINEVDQGFRQLNLPLSFQDQVIQLIGSIPSIGSIATQA